MSLFSRLMGNHLQRTAESEAQWWHNLEGTFSDEYEEVQVNYAELDKKLKRLEQDND